MASSSSSSSSRNWRYGVFVSYHGPDVRKTLIGNLSKQFGYNGIKMFHDQEIKSSQTIGPALIQGMRESRISIVMFTKNYASSSWCLNELVEILKCKEETGKIVMTVFYGADPYHVRNQTGDFGIAFNRTCANKTEVERLRWSQALSYVANIAGPDFGNWDTEADIIEKIASDVSNKLNTTVFIEDMVGIEAHLKIMQSLLHLEYEDEAMIVGICGPAGIGKTTIARALHSRFSGSFQLTCFMENIRGSYNSGLDEYGLKLCLQEKLLSKILNQSGIRIYHLGAIPERLCDQKVLIILDDVDNLQQLEALANKTKWFGPGSRILVITENPELLRQHGKFDMYHVDFPTNKEAREIFRRYALRQSPAPDSFKYLSERVRKLCSNLPLGLRLMGSYLKGKAEEYWEDILHELENSFDPVESVLRIGYDSLQEKDQMLFRLIAFFFNYKDEDHVKAMLAENNNLNVRLGLKTLADKSLIQISTGRNIVMHKLLQQVGREAVKRQAPSQRQILIDANEIREVLESEGVVGLETHLEKILSLLHLDNEDEVMIVGICGPSGIGKSTIARALYSRLSCSFQLNCFMKNLRGSYNSGLDEYGLKLRLKEKLLSKILNQDGMRIYNLGAIPEWLSHQKMLIVLDDVDDLKELEALVNETKWFGPGSRIIVTTENQELLRQHGIDKTYHVDFPSREEALKILCRYAFRQSYPYDGFQELAESVVDLSDNLPLSLRMVGSSLCGKSEEEWKKVIRKLETTTQRVVYEPSSSNKQKSKSQRFTGMAFFVVINLLLEIASAVADQLSSIRKPYFSKISLALSVLSVVMCILDLTYKIRAHKARFRCKWPIPWFYYPARGYRRLFGSFTDTVLLFCVVGGLIVSTINYSFIAKRKDAPIKVSIWPLFFAIGMVASKFMEKPVTKMSTD